MLLILRLISSFNSIKYDLNNVDWYNGNGDILFQFYQVRFKHIKQEILTNKKKCFNSIKYDLNISRKSLRSHFNCFNSIKYDLNDWVSR